VFLFARALGADALVAAGAAFFAAWLPLHARHAAVVNNDVLAKVLAAAAMWLAARHMRGSAGRRDLWLGVLFCALALLTKATAAASLVALALAAALRPRASAALGSARAQRLLALAAAVALVAVAAGAAWIWAGHHTQVLPRSWWAFQERVERGLAAEKWRSFWETFVGRFNWESRGFSGRQYAAALGVAGLLACGVVRAWAGSTGSANAQPGSTGSASAQPGRATGSVDRRALAFCAAIVLAQLALFVLRGEARGRYALPALPALALLATVGLLALAPRRRALTAACGVLALLAYDAFFLWYGLFHNHYVRLGA
jgi:4-amino-4-deoxy-L-arabinose transferase-like glycosyltransferase